MNEKHARQGHLLFIHRSSFTLHRSNDLPGLDSNQDKEDQNLLCYRYTTG